MKNIRSDLFYRHVLRPLWSIYISLSFIYLFNREWVLGFFLAAIWPLIIFIGKGLCAVSANVEALPEMTSPQGGMEGVTHVEGPSEIEDILINKAIFMVAGLIAITATVFAWHYDLTWYGVLLAGVFVWLLSAVAITVCSQYLIPVRAKQNRL